VRLLSTDLPVSNLDQAVHAAVNAQAISSDLTLITVKQIKFLWSH